MTNKDKRAAVTTIGITLTFLNCFMALLWYFDTPENKPGIAFVWIVLNVFVISCFTILTVAYVKYPGDEDED